MGINRVAGLVAASAMLMASQGGMAQATDLWSGMDASGRPCVPLGDETQAGLARNGLILESLCGGTLAVADLCDCDVLQYDRDLACAPPYADQPRPIDRSGNTCSVRDGGGDGSF